jgi:hypothetical protein
MSRLRAAERWFIGNRPVSGRTSRTRSVRCRTVKLYHVTDTAEEILRGFRDARDEYMVPGLSLPGVLLSDGPLTVNEGVRGDQVLEVVLPQGTALDDHELVEEGKPYREWCVPANLLNEGTVRLLDEAQVDALEEDQGLRREELLAHDHPEDATPDRDSPRAGGEARGVAPEVQAGPDRRVSTDAWGSVADSEPLG